MYLKVVHNSVPSIEIIPKIIKFREQYIVSLYPSFEAYKYMRFLALIIRYENMKRETTRDKMGNIRFVREYERRLDVYQISHKYGITFEK